MSFHLQRTFQSRMLVRALSPPTHASATWWLDRFASSQIAMKPPEGDRTRFGENYPDEIGAGLRRGEAARGMPRPYSDVGHGAIRVKHGSPVQGCVMFSAILGEACLARRGIRFARRRSAASDGTD